MNFFDLCEFLSTNIMLPLGGLLIAVFAGWRMSRSTTRDELQLPDGALYATWRFLVRFIAPAGVLVIFLNALGVFSQP